MANVLIEESTMSAIGNAIREKTGKTDLILPADMPTEIEGIESGGSGGGSDWNKFVSGTLEELNSDVEVVPGYLFYEYKTLKRVVLPKANTIKNSAFSGTGIVSVEIPNVITLGTFVGDGNSGYEQGSVFQYCTDLVDVYAPKLENVYQSAFDDCTSLKKIDLPSAKRIGNAFYGCSELTVVCIRNINEVCVLTDEYAFSSTPIKNKTGFIYVPSALIEQYKAATNWATYAAQFRALEDYTVDGTVTGELDETKI